MAVPKLNQLKSAIQKLKQCQWIANLYNHEENQCAEMVNQQQNENDFPQNNAQAFLSELEKMFFADHLTEIYDMHYFMS